MKKGLLLAYSFVFCVTTFSFSYSQSISSKDIKKGFNYSGQLGIVAGGGVRIWLGDYCRYEMVDGFNYFLGLRLGHNIGSNFVAHVNVTGSASTLLISGGKEMEDHHNPYGNNLKNNYGSYEYMAGLGATYYLNALNISLSGTVGAGQFGFVDGETLISEVDFGYQFQLVKEFWKGRSRSWGIGLIYSKLNPTFAEKHYGEIEANGEKFGLIVTASFF